MAPDRKPRLSLPWGPYGDFRGWIRGLAISIVAALFLAFAGAFGSDHAPLLVRFVYWLVLMVLGYALGTTIARLFLTGDGPVKGMWWRVLAIALLLSVPFTAVVSLGTHLAFGAPFRAANLPGLFLSVMVVSLLMTTLNVIVEARRPAEAAATPAPPKFLERLPLKLRGAEVWAVEAEDHYLRLHTSKGQDLILFRLADAVGELEGVEGAQVHRSWWVARDAIADARRGDGRATLVLKDGSEVPVSRTYAGMLREKGWI